MLTTTDVSDIPSIPSAPTMQPVVLNSSPLKDKKLILGVLAGLVILALISAAAFGAYQLGKNQATNPTPTIATPSTPPATPSTNPIVEPASDPTANWKTYTDEKYGYEFKYPINWVLTDEYVVGYQHTIGLRKTDKTQPKVSMPGESLEDPSYAIRVAVMENSNGAMPKDIYLAHFRPEDRVAAEKDLISITVGGENGIYFSAGAAPASGRTKVVQVSHDSNIYEFSYGANAFPDTHLKFYSEFEEILYTFKFL